jgi:biotin carboxylase
LAPQDLILFASTTGYQTRMFADAAERAGARLILATNHCHRLDDPWGDHAIAVKFHRIGWSLDALHGVHCDGILAVGDAPAVLAAEAGVALGVPFHTPAAARAAQDKSLARSILQGKLPAPHFFEATGPEDAARAEYPCVLKPLGASASKGVIRANDAGEFRDAFERIRKMRETRIQVESYIPGREYAIEALATNGRVDVLAIFDKPDPLEGPFFEETIYTTPSRAPEAAQRELVETLEQAARLLGLRHGPIHAEFRHNEDGAWLLEAHARPIGGLCAGALRFDEGMSLEELLVRHALGQDVSGVRRESGAAGVMMIPIPRPGLYRSVSGVAEAEAVPGIERIVITAQEGQRLFPAPEGSTYLGFIFARADSPDDGEAALRRAHACLKFDLAPVLETLRPTA